MIKISENPGKSDENHCWSVNNGVVNKCLLDTIDAKTPDKTEEKSIAHRDSFIQCQLKYEDAIDTIERYCIYQVQVHMCYTMTSRHFRANDEFKHN